MLKKVLLLVTVLLVSVTAAFAQDDLGETYESPELGITLSYPTGWVAEENSDVGGVLFGADSDDIEEVVEALGDSDTNEPVVLAIPRSAADGGGEDALELVSESDTFEVQDDIEETETANGYPVYYLTGFFDQDFTLVAALEGDNGLNWLFLVILPDDSDDFFDTFFAMLDTVELSELSGPVTGATEFVCCSDYAESLDIIEGDSLEYGDSIEGELADDELAIGYTFEGAEGDAVIITVTTDDDDFDTFLVLLDEDGEEVAFNDDFESGNFSLSIIAGELPADGEYTIVVTSFSQDDEGEFELTLEQGTLEGDSGSGGGGGEGDFTYRGAEVADGGTIAYGDSIDGELSRGSYAIAYAFEGVEGDEVTITLEGEDGSDTYVALFNADGEELEYNDDFDGLNVSVIEEFELPEDGTYFIIVTSFSGSAALEFTLELEGN